MSVREDGSRRREIICGMPSTPPIQPDEIVYIDVDSINEGRTLRGLPALPYDDPYWSRLACSLAEARS